MVGVQVRDDDRVDASRRGPGGAACANTPLPQSISSAQLADRRQVAAAGAVAVLPTTGSCRGCEADDRSSHAASQRYASLATARITRACVTTACSAACSAALGKRPGRARAALVAEHEAQLLGRPQAVGVVGAEGRAGRRLGERAEHVATEEAILAMRVFGYCHEPRRNVLSTTIRRPRGSKQARRRATAPASRNTREKRPTAVEMPANRATSFRYRRKRTTYANRIRAVCGRPTGRRRPGALWRPRAAGPRSTVRCTMRILITGPSGAIGAALAGRSPASTSCAGSRATRAACPPSSASSWSAATRSAARAWTARSTDIEVAYYLIHSMEPAPREASPARPHRRPPLRRRRGARRGAADRLPRRRCCRSEGAVSPHLREPRRGRADPARRRSRQRRAARVAGDRRALAILPRDRAADRAPARASRCRRGAAHRTQPIDERDASPTSPRPRRAPGVGGRSLDIAGPEVLSYGAMIERIAALPAAATARRCGCRSTLGAPRQHGRGARSAASSVELLGPLMDSLRRRPARRRPARAQRACGAAARLRRGGRARAARMGGASSPCAADEPSSAAPS